MLKTEKQQLVQNLSEKFTQAASFYLTDFSGLNVGLITELRRKFRQNAVEYKVIKNTLAKIALKNAGFSGLSNFLTGPTAIAYSFDDPTAPVKVLSEFLKEHRELKKPEIKICIFEREVVPAKEAEYLLKLPNRVTLIAMVLGGLNAPITGLVSSLNGIITKLVLTLKAIEEKKSSTEN
ncbi:50S ribosomal protein L10 [candidate division KSB1 bacterium]|nr:50S ribosomal protein L10 [candidate division KSB1 bacterium]